jgi:hypothetical protein
MRVALAFAGLLCCVAVIHGHQQEKPRVFVKESISSELWPETGGFWGAFGGRMQGGARPQTAEIIKTFGERSSTVVVTTNHDRADYTVLLEHEGGKSVILKDNRNALFKHDGDASASGSIRSLGNSVKDICRAIAQHRKAAQ